LKTNSTGKVCKEREYEKSTFLKVEKTLYRLAAVCFTGTDPAVEKKNKNNRKKR
jgi:hypothetical protein